MSLPGVLSRLITAFWAYGLVLPECPAEQASAAPWWDSNWKCRKLVRVRTPRFLVRPPGDSADEGAEEKDGEDVSEEEDKLSSVADPLGRSAQARFSSLDTASAVIYGEKKTRPDLADVRVVNCKGRPVPFRAQWRDDYGFVQVEFRFSRSVSDYYVYFGNPKARAEKTEPDWRPRYAAVERLTAESERRNVRTEEQAILAFKNAPVYYPTEPLEQIDQLRWKGASALRGHSTYVSIYHGFLEVEQPGPYELALAAVSPAFLSLNGRPVVSVIRQHGGGARIWRAQTEMSLSAGIHYVRLIHVFWRRREGLRLGWRPPGVRQVQPIPPSAFIRNFPATEVAYEARGEPAKVFFTVKEPSVAVDLDERRAIVFAQFQDISPVSEEAEGLRYEWDFGGGDTSSERNPARCLTLGRPYSTALRVFRGAEMVGEYVRPVIFSRLDTHESLSLSVKLVSCPNIVYSDEQTDISLEVANGTGSPLRADFHVEMTDSKGPVRPCGHDVVVPGRSYTPLMLPLNMKEFDGGNGEIAITMRLANESVFEKKIVLRRWNEGLNRVRVVEGQFTDDQGSRAILVTDTEDANRYRKWAPVKWLHRVSDRSAKRVSVVGDSMRPDPEGSDASFKNYVSWLRGLPRAEHFQFCETGTGLKPIFRDLFALSELLKQHRPEVVVVCPGLRDALNSSPLRDFTRAIDIMIDLARNQEPPARIVLVSPTPLLSHKKVSEEYAKALRKLAEDHHCAFVDVHSALQTGPDWEQAFFATEEDDQILYLYPNESGQKRIAELIAEEVF